MLLALISLWMERLKFGNSSTLLLKLVAKATLVFSALRQLLVMVCDWTTGLLAWYDLVLPTQGYFGGFTYLITVLAHPLPYNAGSTKESLF